MNTRETDKTTNSRLLNNGTLAAAVAAVIAGSAATTVFAANTQFLLATNSTSLSTATQHSTTAGHNETITAGDMSISTSQVISYSSGTSAGNATTDYLIGHNTTLIFASNNTIHLGNIDAHDTNLNVVEEVGSYFRPSVIVAGNLTMLGNVGSSNSTGNWTINTGNTLTIASNASSNTFNTDNITIEADSTLNLGNSTAGYSRSTADALTMQANITMASGSTINIGNKNTLTGDIVGAEEGEGTVNIVGNFTSGGGIGYLTNKNTASGLEQISVSAGNTFTISQQNNVTATRMNINGTVTVFGSSNITAAVTMGDGSVLNLTNTGSDGGGDAARVTGAIDGYAGATGTLNVNGTRTTAGVIGGKYGLAAINLDNNATTTGHTYTFAHNVNATTINLGNSVSNKNATLQTVKVDNQLIIIGNIVGSTNSTASDNAAGGRFFVTANTTVSGNVGTSSGRLADIRIEDGATLTINGTSPNIYANNITMLDVDTIGSGNNATIAFNGTGTTTVYGIISGENTEGGGTIDINTGTVTFGNTLGTNTNYISNVNVASGSNMTTSSNIYANETIVILGRLDINNLSGITITTNDAQGDGFGLQIGDTSATLNATLETRGTITLNSNDITTATSGSTAAFNNATIKLNGTHSSHSTSDTAYIDIGTNNQTLILQGDTTLDLGLTDTAITDGATIVIIGRGSDSSNNGTLNISGNISIVNYQMFTITTNNSTVGGWSAGYSEDKSDKSLNATVSYRTSTSLGFTGNTKVVYDSAKAAIAADTSVFTALAGLETDAAIKNAIATMHPATGGAAAGSASISGSSMSTAGTRMAYTRQTGLGKGMNAGGATLDESMWVQIFGANVDQDNVSGISGYDADGQGLAMGIDGMSEDGMTRIGIAGSFANTDVTGKDSTTKTTTDIDTTQVMVYANKDYADGMYVEGVASYAFNDNTGTRRILVGAVDRTASSAYDSGVFAVNVEAGWPKENDGVTITPTLGLAYSHLSSDAYTETGAGNMNLKVTPGDVSTFEGKAGVKITGKSVDADGGIGRPEFRLGVTHNFGDKTADSTATFTAGGSSFTTTGVETDSTKVDFGLGYTYTNPEGDTDISVNIDGRKSSSYIQYGSGLTVKWKF